ncbi:MAG TPA: DUF3592 domain-containing protein [Arachidicoccus sp.]|nr:DUF3592 domain-containing protein [Arachidicoccus sp.]
MTPSLILIFISAFMIVFAIKSLIEFNKIKSNGIKTDGIIFDTVNSIDVANNYARSNHPIVRFLTKENQWITQKSKIGVFPGIYKTGKKVQIIYQEEDPNKFFINDYITQAVPWIMIAAAIILIIISIIYLIRI